MPDSINAYAARQFLFHERNSMNSLLVHALRGKTQFAYEGSRLRVFFRLGETNGLDSFRRIVYHGIRNTVRHHAAGLKNGEKQWKES